MEEEREKINGEKCEVARSIEARYSRSSRDFQVYYWVDCIDSLFEWNLIRSFSCSVPSKKLLVKEEWSMNGFNGQGKVEHNFSFTFPTQFLLLMERLMSGLGMVSFYSVLLQSRSL